MVLVDETIMYRNVVWDSYVFHYSEFADAIDEFNDKLAAAKLTVKGPLFYALHNAPLDEKMYIDLYMPVEQHTIPNDSDLKFQTYFYIDTMLMTRVVSNYETDTEKGLEKLLMFVRDNDLGIASPIYHIIRGDDEVNWVDLKVKVFDPNVEGPIEENEEKISILSKYSRAISKKSSTKEEVK